MVLRLRSDCRVVSRCAVKDEDEEAKAGSALEEGGEESNGD